MAGLNTAVSGIYRQKNQAERALDTFIAGGISCSAISVLLFDPELPDAADAGSNGAVADNRIMRSGTGIGGTIGVLAGAGLVAIAGVGPTICAGPIMAGLANADAQPGDLPRALLGIGISDHDAKLYEEQVRCGAILVSVSCSSGEQVSRARELLSATGALEAPVESGPAVTWRLAKP